MVEASIMEAVVSVHLSLGKLNLLDYLKQSRKLIDNFSIDGRIIFVFILGSRRNSDELVQNGNHSFEVE